MNYAYSMNAEDYHGGTCGSPEDAIAESIDELANEVSVGDEGVLYVGEAHPWDADRIGDLMYDAVSSWNDLEERVQERFFEETMCEDGDAINWPGSGQPGTGFQAALKAAMKKLAKDFDIKANWFSVENIKEYPFTVEQNDIDSAVVLINGTSYGFDL